MILPNKYVTVEYTIIGASAYLIKKFEKPKTISTLWEEIRKERFINTYERFILCLDFLYIMNCIDIKEGILFKKMVNK